ncbi:MAG: BlaI/MecI/CopY family transcriptional regulator [Clostridia bacterium]|nr:BlaI/MecI/CopY family transcriptional regulator [Clostridia bacterium]
MATIELGEVQAKFADLVWENAPISSGALVRLCAEELHWKKPTTYTVLRKLCEKGLFENRNGTVTARISRAEYYAAKSEQFVEETFHGSLPAFLAAFTSKKKLTAAQAEELQRMIDAFREEAET